MTTMDLDRNLAQPQFAGDLLVDQSGSDEAHHLSFALGQPLEVYAQVCDPMLVLPAFAVALERGGDRVQHVLIAKRLGEKIDGAGFHGLHRHRDVAVPGHEYDGNVDVRLAELGLKIEPADPRQPDIEDEAACHIGKLAAQQVRGRTERLDLEAHSSKEDSQIHLHVLHHDNYTCH